MLVDAPAIELHDVAVGPLRACRDGRRNRIADAHRAEEPQVLGHVDGARTGELGPEHAGDQRAAPEAVAHQPARKEVVRVLLVDVGRVDIARDRRKQAEVLAGQGLYQARRVARADLVESLVFQIASAHDVPPCITGAGIMCQFGSRSRYF